MLLVLGLEAWVEARIAEPVGRWGQRRALVDLRTRTGRRTGVDALLLISMDGLSRRLHGSASTMAQVLLGRGHQAAQEVMHFKLVEFVKVYKNTLVVWTASH